MCNLDCPKPAPESPQTGDKKDGSKRAEGQAPERNPFLDRLQPADPLIRNVYQGGNDGGRKVRETIEKVPAPNKKANPTSNPPKNDRSQVGDASPKARAQGTAVLPLGRQPATSGVGEPE